MPRGTPAGTPSEQTQRLLDELADIEERLKLQRKRDSGRALLERFAAKHYLTAADLREVAKSMTARDVGDSPVMSKNLTHAKKLAMGRAIRQARVAKGLTSTALGKLMGAKGTAAVVQWENGMMPTLSKYRAGLIKHLDLPKDFFANAPSPTKRGTRSKSNGHAVAS